MTDDSAPGTDSPVTPNRLSTRLTFSPRYLAVKKRIDDRALNPAVWAALERELSSRRPTGPLRVLEVGAGIGAMVERAVDRGLFGGRVLYAATDGDPAQAAAARAHLSAWAGRRRHRLEWRGERRAMLQAAGVSLELLLEPASIETLAAGAGVAGAFDLLIAHAVLDLIDFPLLLPPLLSRLRDRGLAYLSCNFDGETRFLPEADGDAEVIDHYHRSMEERLAGASLTGRRLRAFLEREPYDLVAAGRSDWVIEPGESGYGAGEDLFLEAILALVANELDAAGPTLEAGSAWLDRRRRELAAGRLSLRVRHLDLLVRRGPGF